MTEVPREELGRLSDCFEDVEGPEDVDRCIQDTNLEKLERGTKRHVFEVGNDMVAKVAHPGSEANKREIEVYENLPDELEDDFGEIVAYDGNDWLVMKKYRTLDPREARELTNRLILDENIEDKFERNGIRCGDLRDENFAKTDDGDWRLIDYDQCSVVPSEYNHTY